MTARVVQVTSTAPLEVTELDATVAVPAIQVEIVTGDQAYVPAVGDLVLCVFARGVYWLIGGV